MNRLKNLERKKKAMEEAKRNREPEYLRKFWADLNASWDALPNDKA